MQKEKRGDGRPRGGRREGREVSRGVLQGLCVRAFLSRSREHLGGRVCLRVGDMRSV
jgi:hypothetical protein